MTRSASIPFLLVMTMLACMAFVLFNVLPPNQTLGTAPSNPGATFGFSETKTLEPHWGKHEDECRSQRQEFFAAPERTEWFACGPNKDGNEKFLGLFEAAEGIVMVVVSVVLVSGAFVLWTSFNRKSRADAEAYLAKREPGAKKREKSL